jgi:hypothetical protein
MKATQKLADNYKEHGRASSGYGLEVKRFSDTLLKLISVESQESVGVMTPICKLLERLSANNHEIGDFERRISDDLRDINERDAVLMRTQGEQRAAVKAARDASAALKKVEDEVLVASNQPDFNKAKADARLLKLRDKKKELLVRARDRTQMLIQEQKKFARFRFRRTQEAFVHLGQMITSTGVSEVRIITRLIEGLQKARNLEVLTDTSTETIDVPLPPSASPKAAPKKPEAAEHVNAPKEVKTETHPVVEAPLIIETPPIAESPPVEVLLVAQAEKEGTLHIQWDDRPREGEENDKTPLFDDVDIEGPPLVELE